MSRQDLPGPDGGNADRLQDLEDRLAKAHGVKGGIAPGQGAPVDGDNGASLRMALRVGTELAASLVVGIGLGLLLDRWLGTRPWLTIVFFFVGIAAGMMNVYRAINNLGLAVGYVRPGERHPLDGASGDHDGAAETTDKDGHERD